MPMVSHSREVGLLRTLARNVVSRTAPAPPIGGQLPRADTILPPGHQALAELSKAILDRFPAMERGTTFINFRSELFGYLAENYAGRSTESIGSDQVSTLYDHFSRWFADAAIPRRVFVPCFISPWSAPRFLLGPAVFVFVEEVRNSEFFPRDDPARDAFSRLVEQMRETKATWLACVPIEGCERERAYELGSLAADLALVFFQLAAPAFDTGTMSRLEGRRGTTDKRMISEANGGYDSGWTRAEPGLPIGPGTLHDILSKNRRLATAVGNLVQSFTTGRFRLPSLERAWCDAAYWLHEGLAEPLDSIAIAKLETALEVLVRAESTSGSMRRLMVILEAFYRLKPDDPVVEGSTTTAKQFASRVVNDRSRILHGTSSTLHAVLAPDRTGLERFVIAVIRRTALEIEDYSATLSPNDRIESLLAWTKNRDAAGGTKVAPG